MFSMMGCEVWAAWLDLDDTLTAAALKAEPAPLVLTSLEGWLDEVSVALPTLPPSLGLTLLVPLGPLLLMPPGLGLLPSLPPGLAVLLGTSSDEVGDAPAPDDETGSGFEDSDEGVASSEVEGVGEAEEGAADGDVSDGEVSESEVDDEAESESEVEVADEVEGSGICSDSEEDGAGEADEADDDPPSRQLESLDFSTAMPCWYLKPPVESLTWKIRVSEPAGTLTFQVVESPSRPLRVSRVVEPT